MKIVFTNICSYFCQNYGFSCIIAINLDLNLTLTDLITFNYAQAAHTK